VPDRRAYLVAVLKLKLHRRVFAPMNLLARMYRRKAGLPANFRPVDVTNWYRRSRDGKAKKHTPEQIVNILRQP
jgi:hypothetical protein